MRIATRRFRSGPATMLAVAVAVLALVPAGRADEGKPEPLPAELGWVPRDAAAFVHVRFGEIWNGPVGKAARQALTKLSPQTLDEAERGLGVSLSNLDSITLVWPVVSNRDGPENPVIRINTIKPYKPADVLAALRGGGEPPPGDERDPDLHPIRGDVVVHLTAPKAYTIFSGEKAGVTLLGQLLRRAPDGGLAPGLRAAAGKHAVVAGLNPARLPRVPAGAAPVEVQPFLPLFEARAAAVTLDLGGKEVTGELTLTFDKPAGAADGQKAARAALTLAQELLAEGVRQLSDDKESAPLLALVREASGVLKTARVRQEGTRLVVAVRGRTEASLSALLLQAGDYARFAGARVASQNNLKMIALAFHNYHDTFGHFPKDVTDKNGKVLLSWRVAILPFVEQDALYREFKLDEPWDSDHNKKLISRMPKLYLLPGERVKHERVATFYQGFAGPGAILERERKIKIADITDGTSNTLMVVEAAEPVVWTKPADISYDPKKPPALGYHFRNRCNAAFCDGSVRALKKGIDEQVLHLLIQRGDGMVIPNIDY